MVKKVLLIGGNIIQYYMAKSLSERGFAIFHYGVEFPEKLIGVKRVGGKEELLGLLHDRDCIAAFPMTDGQDKYVYMEGKYKDTLPFLDCMTDVSCFLWYPGQKIKYDIKDAFAEAAVVEAKLLSGKTICGANALVLGFGVYAERIAEKLRDWGCHVVVVPDDDMEQKLAGYRGFKLCAGTDLMSYLSDCDGHEDKKTDFVFQCSRIYQLLAPQLCRMPREAVLLNLTQREGAVDVEYARFMKLQTKHCRHLLLEYAPAVTGKLLAEELVEKMSQ